MNIQKTTTPHPFNRIKAIVTSYMCVNAIHPMRWASELERTLFYFPLGGLQSVAVYIWSPCYLCEICQSTPKFHFIIVVCLAYLYIDHAIVQYNAHIQLAFLNGFVRYVAAVVGSLRFYSFFLSLLCIRSPACTDILNRNLSEKREFVLNP